MYHNPHIKETIEGLRFFYAILSIILPHPFRLADVDIWSAVFELAAHASPKPRTPPTASEKAVFDMPLRSRSASQRGIEQTHDEIDQRILEELTGRAYYDTWLAPPHFIIYPY